MRYLVMAQSMSHYRVRRGSVLRAWGSRGLEAECATVASISASFLMQAFPPTDRRRPVHGQATAKGFLSGGPPRDLQLESQGLEP